MKLHGCNRTNADYFSFYKRVNSPFGVQLNVRTADGCTYETVLELESERVIYQSMVYAGNDIAYVNSEGNLVGYQGTNGAGSSVQKIYSGESITWDSSPVSESQTFTGLSYEDVSVGFGTINYCWYLYYNGYAYISEKGVPITGITAPYSSGSEFKISREGGNIVYSVDGVVYRTVPDLYPDSSMVADATLYGIPGVDVTVRNLMINRMTEVQYADCGEASGINRKYRYGFNGMEKDDEAKGAGNSYNFGARFYDSRLGRWLIRDPHEGKYPTQSPYSFSFNSPLMFNDPNGKDAIVTITPNQGPNGDVTIITYSTKVYLMGTGVDQEYLDHVEHYAKSAFQTRDVIVDGQKYQVVFNVEFVNAETNNAMVQEKLPVSIKEYKRNNYNKGARIYTKAYDVKKRNNYSESNSYLLEYGDNVILTGQTTIQSGGLPGDGAFTNPMLSQAWIGTYPSNLNNPNVSSQQKAAFATIHELFHLLGLSDRVGQAGFETDWMSEFSEVKADLLVTLDSRHIENLVKIALSLTNDDKVKIGRAEQFSIGKKQGNNIAADSAVDSSAAGAK